MRKVLESDYTRETKAQITAGRSLEPLQAHINRVTTETAKEPVDTVNSRTLALSET